MQQSIDFERALGLLKEGNSRFINGVSKRDISASRRLNTALHGQNPYAVIIACSDSRTAPELIFDSGIGDIFVVRTAGNLAGELELGSVEYACEHLGTPLVVVLGHDNCGAVAAAMEGKADGHIQSLLDEVKAAIGDEHNAAAAEDANIRYVVSKVNQSPIIRHLTEKGRLKVVAAKYDVLRGDVDFWA